MSVTRILAGLTVRTDLDPFADGRNLAINLGVVALSVVLGLRDLKARDALLEEIAIELGERKPQILDEDAQPAGSSDEAE